MRDLRSGKVAVVPYDPTWREKYAREAKALWAAVGDMVEEIEHVGSTAIPGMTAKPIIDIAMAVADGRVVDSLVPRLEALGYVYRGLLLGIEGHFFFRKGDPREYFLHVLEHRSESWTEHIAFRDYLVAHDDVAGDYRQLKEHLATKHADSRKSYTASKKAFVEKVTAIAVRAQRSATT